MGTCTDSVTGAKEKERTEKSAFLHVTVYQGIYFESTEEILHGPGGSRPLPIKIYRVPDHIVHKCTMSQYKLFGMSQEVK